MLDQAGQCHCTVAYCVSVLQYTPRMFGVVKVANMNLDRSTCAAVVHVCMSNREVFFCCCFFLTGKVFTFSWGIEFSLYFVVTLPPDPDLLLLLKTMADCVADFSLSAVALWLPLSTH